VLFFAVFRYCTLAVVFARTVEIVRRREGECCVVNGRLDACMMYLYKTVGICIWFISLCLLRPSTYFPLNVLRVFKGDGRWVTRVVAIQISVNQS